VFNELDTTDPATSELLPSNLHASRTLSLFIKDRLSLRQFFAGPVFHQILGIPVGPIRVRLADAPPPRQIDGAR
jgi:hypothetical protein